jgi:hypothetical protein
MDPCHFGNIIYYFNFSGKVSDVNKHMIISPSTCTIGEDVFQQPFGFIQVDSVPVYFNKSFFPADNVIESIAIPFCQVPGDQDSFVLTPVGYSNSQMGIFVCFGKEVTVNLSQTIGQYASDQQKSRDFSTQITTIPKSRF